MKPKVKYNIFIYLVTSLLVSSCYGLGTLDLSELNSVQYNVQILDTPVSETEIPMKLESETPAPPTMTMVNKEGQKYRCYLPLVPETDEKEDKTVEEAVPDIAKLLSPLEDGICMYKTKDWWTYEVCYKGSVRQYHVENDKPVGDIMVLGIHDADKDNFEKSNSTYLPQWYTNGTKCDLTGKPRQTELRFVCNEAAVQDFIGDIFEPQSCEYTIVLHTSKLCSVPWLRPVAEPTPLPITCKPLLTNEQMEKYNKYLEKKKLADALALKQKEAKKAEEMAKKSTGISSLGDGVHSLDGLLSSMGDSMAENLVSEISSLLDKAMAGENAGGIKVIDLRKDNEEGAKDVVKSESVDEKPVIETKASEGWDLVHHKHTPPSDPVLRELIQERNLLWRRIHEHKKLVKKYTSQLHDSVTFLKSEQEASETLPAIDDHSDLKAQIHSIETALSMHKRIVADLEVESKDLAHKIVAQQAKLSKRNTMHEEITWLLRLDQIEDLMKNVENVFMVLLDISADYMKVTNELPATIDDYFKVSKKIVGDKIPSSRMKKLQTYLTLYQELLPSREEVLIHIADQAEMPEDKVELPKEDLVKAAKFKDLVKDDVRDQFQDILKEVSEELEIPDGDVDKDEAMAAMTDTLDKLMDKLAGAGEKIDKVQQTVNNLKKISNDKEATDEMLSLKRDNKKSVKKDLSRLEEDETEGDDIDEDYDDADDLNDDGEEDGLDEAYENAVENLKEVEADVSRLEKEMREKRVELDNVKVSVTSLAGIQSDEDTEKVVKKLEETLKDKLSKLGLETGGRPIEVKLITTQIPEGLGEGAEGDDAQVQGMFFNMMTGNIQGYEDITSQRQIESNYKFSWDESSIDDIEKKISEFESGTNNENLETNDNQVLDDLYHGGDQRQRPSSLHSKIDSESDNQANSDEKSDDYELLDVKDEL